MRKVDRTYSVKAVYTADMLAHLANIMHGRARIGGLSSAQSEALGYFVRANRVSRTVSAFAEFRVTTRGTASQTIKGLVERGLLVRTRSSADSRRSHLDVTEQGQALWDSHNAMDMVEVIQELPDFQQTALLDAVAGIIQSVSGAREARVFRPCVKCRHFKRISTVESSDAGCFCKLTKSLLPSSEPTFICMFFSPGVSGE